MRGDALGLLHGLPAGIKDLDETGGLLTTYGSPLYRDFVPERDNAMVARVRAAGAVVVGKTNVPEFGAGANSRNFVWGATGNPSIRCSMRAARRVALPSRSRTNMLPLLPAPNRRVAAHPGRDQRRRRVPAVAGTRARGAARARLDADIGGRPDGRTVADTSLSSLHKPRWIVVIRCRIRSTRGQFATLEAPDLASLRVAFTEDFDVSPVDQPIRKVFREKVAAMRHLFRSCDEVRFDFGEADAASTSFVRRITWRVTATRTKRIRARSAPTCARITRSAAEMTLATCRMGATRRDDDLPPLPATFRDYDLVLAPTTPVSPFPWSQLYLAEMDGKPLNNYYHWLSLTYVVTLVTNPAISIPAAPITKACRSDCRPSALPRGSCAAGHVPCDRAGIRWHSRFGASATRSRQANETDTGIEVDRDASTGSVKQFR